MSKSLHNHHKEEGTGTARKQRVSRAVKDTLAKSQQGSIPPSPAGIAPLAVRVVDPRGLPSGDACWSPQEVPRRRLPRLQRAALSEATALAERPTSGDAARPAVSAAAAAGTGGSPRDSLLADGASSACVANQRLPPARSTCLLTDAGPSQMPGSPDSITAPACG